MEYKHLTPEDMDLLDKNTLTQIEREHYANTLALKRAEALKDNTQIEHFTKEIADLEVQYDALA